MVALAFRDAVYLIDFHVTELRSTSETSIEGEIIAYLQSYELANQAKIIAAGIPRKLGDVCSSLCSRLWLELDIIPIVIPEKHWTRTPWHGKRVDEQADSMARRCIM